MSVKTVMKQADPLRCKFQSRRSPVLSTRGMVASTQPLASQVGLRILQDGGTAADAAIGMAAALNVTEPCCTGIGGDAFSLYYEAASQKVHCLMGNGKSPRALTLQVAIDRGITDNKMPLTHPLTVLVPGAASLWDEMMSRWGNMSLKEVLSPAIDLANEGFPVAPVAARLWQANEHILKGPGCGALLNKADQAPQAGEMMRNHDLGNTFLEIASKGAKQGFYSGRIADAIVNAVQDLGGVLEKEDLSAHTILEVDPLCSQYRGINIWEAPPPTQGIVALLGLSHLEGVEGFPELDWGGVQHLHSGIEAIRMSFFDALQYNCDPESNAVPIQTLLDKDWAKRRRGELAIGDKAAVFQLETQRNGIGESVTAGGDTTYFNVVDSYGNGCSFIMSNYCGFGTGIVPEGCGFSLQNRGHSFILDEEHPNCIGPCKKPYHTLIPGMSTHSDGRLHSVFGVMGGFMQPQGHLQVLSNMLDFGMDPQTALDAPRFCVEKVDSSIGPQSVQNSRVLLEKGFSPETMEGLKLQGHTVSDIDGMRRTVFGRGQVILLDDSGVMWGGSDPRGDGMALGW